MNYNNRNWKIESLITNNAWNHILISQIFPPQLAIDIISQHLPKFANAKDILLWRFTTDGQVTVKSAYRVLNEQDQLPWTLANLV